MRRILGGLAVLLGICALVLGLRADNLYSRLAKVPLDQKSQPISEGTGITALRVSRPEGSQAVKFDRLTDQHVRNVRNIVGIPSQVPEGLRDTNAYWQVGFRTEIVDGQVLDLSEDGVSIDRTSALATNCCQDYASKAVDGKAQRVPMQHEGLFFKFPFNAQKRSYPFWDAQLKSARDAVFVRTEKLQGLDTYVYEQKIPTTRLPGSQQVPRSMVGASGPGNVTGQVDYSNTRTFWVEPATGIIIKGQEDIDRQLVTDAGSVTLIKGLIGYNEATQKAFADEYGPKAKGLTFVRDQLKTVGLVLGTLLTLLGLFMLFKARRLRGRHLAEERAPHGDDDRMPAGTTHV